MSSSIFLKDMIAALLTADLASLVPAASPAVLLLALAAMSAVRLAPSDP